MSDPNITTLTYGVVTGAALVVACCSALIAATLRSILDELRKKL